MTGLFEHFHGEVTRVPVDATAVPHREPGYNFLVTSVWTDPAARRERRLDEGDLRRAGAVPRQSALPQLLLGGRRRRRPVRAAYGPNYERLVELKKEYDPENVFHLNTNVAPG